MQNFKSAKSAICKGGHLQTSVLEDLESFEQKCCSQCGKEIIDKCPHCNAPIKGGKIVYKEKIVDMLGGKRLEKQKIANHVVPNYCTNCGKPFPWVEELLETYKELIDTENEEFKEKITKTTENLLRDRFSKDSIYLPLLKKQLNKIPEASRALLFQVLASVASSNIIDILKK